MNCHSCPISKVDRVRLEQFDAERPIEARDRLDDPLIEEIAHIYEAVLGVRGLSPDDNVESLGGDSLQAITIQVELEHRFGVLFPEYMIEQRPSIHEIAQFLITRSDRARTAR